MNFAYIEQGALVRFLVEIPPTFKGVSHVRSLSAAEQAALGILPVVDLTPPFNPETVRLAKAHPVFTIFADRVELVRPTEPIPTQEITERTARREVQNDARAVELRDKLRTATPAEISAYVDAQVLDLASARTMFKRVLLVLALMARS